MRTGTTLFLAILLTGGAAYAAPSPLEVYDVTTYGATAAYDCGSDQAGIQAAIEAAHTARGGTVYFPPGTYCITGEILGHENITLKGASMAGANAASASVLQTAPDFDGTAATIIGMANKNGGNYGFALEDLSIYVPVITGDESAGFTAVDFTGVWYGAIRGVAVAGEAFGPDPNLLHSANSVGFLFDDNEGSSACFGNVVERTSAFRVGTAYKFVTHHNQSLNTMTNFWVSDCRTGVSFSNLSPPGQPNTQGNIGLSFRDGYMATQLSVLGKKAFEYIGGGAPTIQLMNIQYETYSVNNPYFGFEGGSDLGTSGITGLAVLAAGTVVLDGDVRARSFSPTVMWADGYYCGASASCACAPERYPCPQSMSFWARIPAGRTIHAGGVDDFKFQTTVGYAGEQGTQPFQDVYFTFHPTQTANIGQMFQMAATNTVESLGTNMASFETYVVKIFVNNDVLLNSDFVFFLEANRSTAQQPPPPNTTCGG